MGKRRNKKKNNKLRLKDVCTERKNVLSDQNDTKEIQQHSNKNKNPQVLFSKKNIEGKYQTSVHEKPSNIELQKPVPEKPSNIKLQKSVHEKPSNIKLQKSVCEKPSNIKLQKSVCEKPSNEFQISNEETRLNSCIRQFSSTKLTSNTSEYRKETSIMLNRDQHVSSMSGAIAKYKFSRVDSNPGRYLSDDYDFKCGSPHFLHNISDSEEEYTSSDFSKSDFDNFDELMNYREKLPWRKSDVKENLYTSVNEYNSSKNSFLQMFKKWVSKRKETLAKLQSLYEEVLSAQKQYNAMQVNCKDVSTEMRKVVIQSESATGCFFASLAGFVSNAVSGMSSLSQAFSVDCFQTKFQEIMDHDSKITQEMYENRSQCVTKYQGIEEVMRKFHHSDTFSSTIGKISSTLEVGRYWESMKTAYKNDDMETLLNTVGKFFNNACQSEVLGEIGNAVDRYVADNPAALEACKSTSKAVYGAVNTWAPNFNRSGVMGKVNCATNCYLMIDDMAEADRFRSAADDDCQGSKLAIQIEDALESLQSEMKEMNDIYLDCFKKERHCIEYDFEY